jgi:hypothetical protein
MNGPDDTVTTKAEDEACEAAVLRRLIELHPTTLTVAEVIRELAGESAGFSERDAIERAARELSGSGLLHLRDDFVTPTRAALRFGELLDH